jgi:hypothetical protein
MVDNIINNSDIISNNGIVKQKQDILGVEKKTSAKNPYETSTNEIDDKSEISDEALALFDKYQEIEKYKKMVLSSLNESTGTNEIVNLIETGKYKISDEDLADSLMQDNDFLKMVYAAQ